MTSAPGFPLKRIALTIALSLLVHSLLLWKLPEIKFPQSRELLPPLQAKLEPLPKLAKQPVIRKPLVRNKKTKHFAKRKAVIESVVASATAIADTAASSVAAEPVAASAVAAANTPAATPAPAEQTVTHPLLPRHARLDYAVRYSSGTFKVGEVSHVLDNVDGHYTLRATTQTTGLVGIFKGYRLSQTSTGTVTKDGLRPDSYVEVKSDGSGTKTANASFDWIAHKIHFADGTEKPLADNAQDILSLPYQFSQLPLNVESIAVALSNGKNISQYYIAIGDEGSIKTAMGDLRTLTLYKVHGANEDGLIIWLALEYRLLPVKIVYLDKSGAVSANMVITDIRVSDN